MLASEGMLLRALTRPSRSSLFLASSWRSAACRPLSTHLRRTPRSALAHQRRGFRLAALLKPWDVLVGQPRQAAEAAGGEAGSAEQQAKAAAAAMAERVREVYENQRFYGITWKAPPVLDRAGWTDPSGAAVEFATAPAEDGGGWEVVVTHGTDEDGWQYGTVFHHLEFKRPGGRSSQRWGDMVRRRLWRRRSGGGAGGDGDTCLNAAAVALPGAEMASTAGAADASAGLAGAAGAELGGAAGAASARSALNAYEAEAKKRAMRAFMSLVLDLLQRRKLWSIIPWDPAALLVLYRKHQEVYQQLQAQAYERRLFTADQAAPPSPLRPDQRTMLQDMLAAAMHSRAAYGYPMAAGHVSSVAAYVKLQTVQQLSFDAVGGVSVEANNEAVGALAGIDPADILLSQWKNSTYRPCHYVAIDRANQCVVVSIRGSLQVGDLLSDLSAHPMEVALAGVESGGWVHQGIFAAATYIQCNVAAALEEAGRRCPGWPLLITGHSLGGGVAALLAMLMKQSGLPPGLGRLHCITMGTAAVVSENIAAACEDYVTSVIVGSDVVPHLSYASVEALLVESSEASPVRQAAERAADTLGKTITQAQLKVSEALEGLSLPESLVPDALIPDAARKAVGAFTGAGRSGSAAGGQASWRPLRDATAAGSGSSGGLTRLLPFYADEDVMQVAAAEAAAGGPANGKQQQWGQQQQGANPRMIPIIDLSQGEEAWLQSQQQAAAQAATAGAQQPRGGAPQQQPLQQQAQRGGGSRAGASQLAAATLGASAGLEGMLSAAPSEDVELAEWPSGVSAAAAEAEGPEESLPYTAAGADAGLLGAAMAQEEVVHPRPSEGSPSSSSAAAIAQGGGDKPTADPELLYPPGRLIWIFPADEDLSSLSGADDVAAVAAGVAAGTAQAAVGGVWRDATGWAGEAPPVGPGEVELTGAGASAAAGAASAAAAAAGSSQPGAAGPPRVAASELEGLRHESEAATERMAAKEAAHLARGERAAAEPGGTGGTAAGGGSSKGAQGGNAGSGADGGGEVSIGEAMEEVEGDAEGGARAVDMSLPVVAEADRASFSRILVMPSFIDDHIPDRYVQALQQL